MRRERSPLPSQEVLKSLFDYFPETGLLIRKDRTHWTSKGQQCGHVNAAGYCVVGIGKPTYYAHRIIWKIVYDEEPDMVDHKNNIGSDNRINNLRAATHTQNTWNGRGLRVLSGIGSKGVHFCHATQKWRAQIRHLGVRHHLGRFETEVEAHAAYVNAAKDLHGDFANAGVVETAA